MEILVTKENAVLGLRVKRGRDWGFGDQDQGGVGTIVSSRNHFPVNPDRDWCKVQWDNGTIYHYRIRIVYDLYVHQEQPKEPKAKEDNYLITTPTLTYYAEELTDEDKANAGILSVLTRRIIRLSDGRMLTGGGQWI